MQGRRVLYLTVALVSLSNISVAFMLLLFPLLANRAIYAEDGPSFRGPQGTGVSTEAVLPATWNATKNLAWRAPLPDRGNSTPIVRHDRVFVTQATDQEVHEKRMRS